MSVTVERTAKVAGLLNVQPSPGAETALWALGPDERVAAMWSGELTLFQLTRWAAKAPDEVPRLGGEFAFLVMRDPEWCEPSHPVRSAGR